MNTSAGADEAGGGRKHRISASSGDVEVVLVVDFELFLLRSLVDEIQCVKAELDVASACREVAGDDGATAMLWRRYYPKL
jgi:hypothetical protein